MISMLEFCFVAYRDEEYDEGYQGWSEGRGGPRGRGMRGRGRGVRGRGAPGFAGRDRSPVTGRGNAIFIKIFAFY